MRRGELHAQEILRRGADEERARGVTTLQLLSHEVSARAGIEGADDGGEDSARAVVEGMPGESTASAVCKPYASFRVVEPNARTKRRPRRSPKPVLMKARAKKVATTMSQMTSLVSAARPCWNVSVRDATVTVSAMKAQAPTGAGLMTRPVTVEQKMAKRDHAWGVSTSGTGRRKRTARPTPTAIAALT